MGLCASSPAQVAAKAEAKGGEVKGEAKSASMLSGEFAVLVRSDNVDLRSGTFFIGAAAPFSIGVKNGGFTVCDVFLYFEGASIPLAGVRLEAETSTWIDSPTWAPEPQQFVAGASQCSNWNAVFRPRRAGLPNGASVPVPFTGNMQGWTPNNGKVSFGRYAGQPPANLIKAIPDTELDADRHQSISFRISTAK